MAPSNEDNLKESRVLEAEPSKGIEEEGIRMVGQFVAQFKL